MGPQERADLVRLLRSDAASRDRRGRKVAERIDTVYSAMAAQAIEDLEASEQRWKEATEAAHEAMEEQGEGLQQVRAQRDELVKVARNVQDIWENGRPVCDEGRTEGSHAGDCRTCAVARSLASLSPATAALLEDPDGQ